MGMALGFFQTADQIPCLNHAAVPVGVLLILRKLADQRIRLGVAFFTVGMGLALGKGADQILRLGVAILSMAVGRDLVNQTDQGVFHDLASLAVQVLLHLGQGTHQHAVFIITKLPMLMQHHQLTVGGRALGNHFVGAVAPIRMGMLFQAADGVAGLGDRRQHQGINRAEHHHGCHSHNDILPNPVESGLLVSAHGFPPFIFIVYE